MQRATKVWQLYIDYERHVVSNTDAFIDYERHVVSKTDALWIDRQTLRPCVLSAVLSITLRPC